MYAIIKIPTSIDVNTKLLTQIPYLTKSGLFDGSSVWVSTTRVEAEYKVNQLNQDRQDHQDHQYIVTLY